MASLMAEQVALEAIKTVRKGEKPNIYRIQRKHGYSHASAKSMKATTTKTYKITMADFVSKMKKIKQKNLDNLEVKVNDDENNNKSTIRDHAYLDDLMTKNINLLEGKATEITEEKTDIKSIEDAKEYLKKALNE